MNNQFSKKICKKRSPPLTRLSKIMTTLEYCIKCDFVKYLRKAPLNDKEHGKSQNEEFKAFERVVFLQL